MSNSREANILTFTKASASAKQCICTDEKLGTKYVPMM